MANYIIGQQPPKTRFTYDTDSKKLTVSVDNNEPVGISAGNGIIPLKNITITGSGYKTITLDNQYNCYTIKPSGTCYLRFDNLNVKQDVGGEFYLMIDLSDGVKTIYFPSSFQWKINTVAPTMNAKKLYIFKCMYLYTDPIAYTGQFLAAVDNLDYDNGLWIFDKNTGKVIDGYAGIEYSDQPITVNYNQKVVVKSGTFTRLYLETYFNQSYDWENDIHYDVVLKPDIEIHGGTFSSIDYTMSNDSVYAEPGTYALPFECSGVVFESHVYAGDSSIYKDDYDCYYYSSEHYTYYNCILNSGFDIYPAGDGRKWLSNIK
jgi:hypothetical protein